MLVLIAAIVAIILNSVLPDEEEVTVGGHGNLGQPENAGEMEENVDGDREHREH